MLDHIGVQAADVEASVGFYSTVLAPLGVHEAARFPGPDGLVVGFAGPEGSPEFWLSPARRPDDRELHVAFSAQDRAAVDAVYDAAVRAGVDVLNPPREWPEYHQGYYAVFLRDLDGHNVEAVFHGSPA